MNIFILVLVEKKFDGKRERFMGWSASRDHLEDEIKRMLAEEEDRRNRLDIYDSRDLSYEIHGPIPNFL